MTWLVVGAVIWIAAALFVWALCAAAACADRDALEQRVDPPRAGRADDDLDVIDRQLLA